MQHGRLKTLFPESVIQGRIAEMAWSIAEIFRGNELVILGLLRGSFIFLADLARALHKYQLPLKIDFMMVSSYGSDTRSSGVVEIENKTDLELKDQKVLLVDDILDSGRTLHLVSEYLLTQNPSCLRTCVLLDKPSHREIPFQADFVGFTIPNTFVVGYGLDLNNRYREMPYISCLADGEGEAVQK